MTVNAPFCAQESPNTPGRIFGYGEGDLASASPAASSASPGTAAATSSATATPEAVAPKATPSEASPATKAKPAKDDVTKTKPAKDDTTKAKPAKPHLSEPSEATEAGQGQPDKAAVDEKKLPDTSGPVASLAWVPLVVLLGIGGLLGIWTWLMNRPEA